MRLVTHYSHPDSNWFEEIDIPMGIVNVVEDARIEKMMKRKYAGQV